MIFAAGVGTLGMVGKSGLRLPWAGADAFAGTGRCISADGDAEVSCGCDVGVEHPANPAVKTMPSQREKNMRLKFTRVLEGKCAKG